MSLLVLVRHAKSARKKAPPGTRDWPLSKKGRKDCPRIAGLLRPLDLETLVSSPLVRARETAELIAAELGLEWSSLDDLRESEPAETEDETLRRYTAAVESVLAREPGRNVGIVSHGTVMALYAAPRFEMEPSVLWDAIGQPCILVIDRESGRGLRIIDSFDSPS